MQITELEKQGIENIALNLYTTLNGAMPTSADDATCWANCLTDGPNKLSGKKLSGIVASLVKKELAWTDGESCGLTDDGFKAFIATR